MLSAATALRRCGIVHMNWDALVQCSRAYCLGAVIFVVVLRTCIIEISHRIYGYNNITTMTLAATARAVHTALCRLERNHVYVINFTTLSRCCPRVVTQGCVLFTRSLERYTGCLCVCVCMCDKKL